MLIGERLQTELTNKGLKQKELALAISVPTSTINNWIKKSRDIPSQYIIPICEFLKISVPYFLTGKEIETKKIEVIPDPELKRMIDILTEIMSDPDPRRRAWATIQFEDAFRSYCALHDEKKMQA
jgi:bacteriophage CI repressor helix-turn-helix domain